MLISQIDVDSINGNFADMGFRFVQPSDSLRISIVLMDGSVVYDSNNETVKENHRNRPEISNAIKNGEAYTILRQSAVDNSEYFYSATLANGYIVRTAIPYNQSALNDMLKIDTAYIWITVFIAVVLSIVAYFASCRIGMSIKLLRDFAVKAEKRKLKDNEKYDFPNDELGEISSHIINMYRDLNKALLERDKSMNDLITEEREKNRIKNQLTSNINHELKTPVHTIQACIETIINNRYRMNENQVDELMRTCHDNVKRLCDLLRDITTLTDINDNSCQIAKEQLNVSNLVASVCRDISSRQAEHSIRINNYLPDGIEISGNKSLVESIFSNLINNAVLYSGGRDIFIKLK
ncbi:MAG: histidine kinase dimerization/phospho-acceptor domain-containing protein, partial [Muribaculaceae bacterium]